eukprot:3537138-Prymnesium_polylepis.2
MPRTAAQAWREEGGQGQARARARRGPAGRRGVRGAAAEDDARALRHSSRAKSIGATTESIAAPLTGVPAPGPARPAGAAHGVSGRAGSGAKRRVLQTAARPRRDIACAATCAPPRAGWRARLNPTGCRSGGRGSSS